MLDCVKYDTRVAALEAENVQLRSDSVAQLAQVRSSVTTHWMGKWMLDCVQYDAHIAAFEAEILQLRSTNSAPANSPAYSSPRSQDQDEHIIASNVTQLDSDISSSSTVDEEVSSIASAPSRNSNLRSSSKRLSNDSGVEMSRSSSGSGSSSSRIFPKEESDSDDCGHTPQLVALQERVRRSRLNHQNLLKEERLREKQESLEHLHENEDQDEDDVSSNAGSDSGSEVDSIPDDIPDFQLMNRNLSLQLEMANRGIGGRT